MLHNSLKVKEFTIKENSMFRLRVKSWKCVSRADLNSIKFIQECIKDGEVNFTSTYNFFMADDKITALAKG